MSGNRSDVSRGKVTGTKMGPRTLLQVTGLDGVVMNTVELLLPPGYSANPASASDVALVQVLGNADHVVALGGDLVGNAIADLEPGEFGLSNGDCKVIVRGGGLIQIIASTKIRFEAPRLECTGEIVANCDGAFVTLMKHEHPENETPPDPNK